MCGATLGSADCTFLRCPYLVTLCQWNTPIQASSSLSFSAIYTASLTWLGSKASALRNCRLILTQLLCILACPSYSRTFLERGMYMIRRLSYAYHWFCSSSVCSCASCSSASRASRDSATCVTALLTASRMRRQSRWPEYPPTRTAACAFAHQYLFALRYTSLHIRAPPITTYAYPMRACSSALCSFGSAIYWVQDAHVFVK